MRLPAVNDILQQSETLKPKTFWVVRLATRLETGTCEINRVGRPGTAEFDREREWYRDAAGNVYVKSADDKTWMLINFIYDPLEWTLIHVLP